MPASRREFLKSSSLTFAGAAAGAGLSIVQSAHAAGTDVLKVGLIGCGGRGTGAAAQALKADKAVKLWAMGDAFADRLELSLSSLQKEEDVKDKLDVAKERQFVGFDAYQKVIDSGVDVVLLTSPPHFRPIHLKAAVDAGKHIFAEKPIAVDGPGVRSVLATCQAAAKKNLSVVSGLCLRYSYGFQEAVKRIHDGQIGDIVMLQANDLRGPIWVKPRQPEWTDMDWQMRNWYYFTWLSGDFNVEQHVHYLDIGAWLMGNKYPEKAVGMGGRQVRTGSEYGNIYDHLGVMHDYDNGVKFFSQCRQITGCKNDQGVYVLGTKGRAEVSEKRLSITNNDGATWKFSGKSNPFYQTEHDELFASIRSGKPINNGDYMSQSTLLGIMGRTTCYTGQEVTWKQMVESQQDLSPAKYEWGKIATPEIAIPGVTKVG